MLSVASPSLVILVSLTQITLVAAAVDSDINTADTSSSSLSFVGRLMADSSTSSVIDTTRQCVNTSDRRVSAATGEGETRPFSAWQAAFIACFCGLIVIGTVVGNVLVCSAVALVRRLRTPSNLLIVSLAVSDLLVAVLDMPFAIAYEVMGRWELGETMCDAWTSLDVLLCTSSILNLCAISIDRYFVITRPFQYAIKRTPGRMAIMIAIVWSLSAVISIPPLIGWKRKRLANDGECMVSQDLGYQIYATIGAFYLPLTVMIVIYVRIFLVSSRIARAEALSKPSFDASASLSSSRQTYPHDVIGNSCSTSRLLLSQPLSPTSQQQQQLYPSHDSQAMNVLKTTREPTDIKPQPTVLEYPSDSTLIERPNSDDNVDSDKSIMHPIPPAIQNGNNRQPTINNLDLTSIELVIHISPAADVIYSSTENDAGEPDKRKPTINGRVVGNHTNTSNESIASANGNGSVNKPLQVPTRRSSRLFSLVDQLPVRRSTLTGNQLRSRSLSVGAVRRISKLSTSNDLKATKTLGVIMGAFTACWLPFFILALVRPFCGEQSACIPHWLAGFLLWLGYTNSLLNPIIYARFNRDFRTPFRHLLQCHVRDINERLRSDNYTEQYGVGAVNTSGGAVVARSNSVACSNWLLEQHRPNGSVPTADGLA